MIDVIKQKCPIAEQDVSVKLFGAEFTALVSRMVSWTKDGAIAQYRQWVCLPSVYREMSSASRF
jgi:hypothetical protein